MSCLTPCLISLRHSALRPLLPCIRIPVPLRNDSCLVVWPNRARSHFPSRAQPIFFDREKPFRHVQQSPHNDLQMCSVSKRGLREVVLKKAGRLRLPTGVTAVEQCQANGRAEQRVRALRERLQIMVGDARRRAETMLDNLVAQWAVGHAERSQNFVVKADVDMSGGGTINTTQHDAHTGDNAPSNVVGSSFSKQNQRSLTAHFLVD